jgi:hypothetical protein
MPATTPSIRPTLRSSSRGPKRSGVEQRDRPGSHGEDVAQDAAHPGGGALERLHRRGVVVAFDLEGGGRCPSPTIHHAGVLARAHQDAGAAGGEALQQRPGVAVAAVLRPHHPEHAQFGPVGITAEPATDLLVVGLGQALLAQGPGQ